ncbi:Gfo/Idh/MocA family oxidoreductase [Salinivibrio sp. AR640]|uniref:Gfo/Idh/MocA family oxidoreductase n=1 Tax=Salinivibrio sp. AR640 TaxID=1909437 RepID=UPI0009871B91|nr:Gfo/Idh/MocA family oxidoreductase [Salinivibrio sp. AR640]OOE93155.1 dehydrogenase [Salinivibrio sp. AR640]
MNNVLIIGAGQLGSRHLQGALVSSKALNLTVVDSSEASLSVARERAGQVEQGNEQSQVTYQTEMPSHQSFDVCLIATAAHARAHVTKYLLATNTVIHIIFEKVLFQALADYTEIDALLESSKTTGWVNCPRRVFPTYIALKETLSPDTPIHMDVSGHGWGMACNSIHFLDLFAYLSGHSELKVTKSQLDDALIESKRAGFYEVTGEIEFSAGPHTVRVHSGLDTTPSLDLVLTQGTDKHIVNEVGGTWQHISSEETMTHPHAPLYQSQLTGPSIDALLDESQCALTPYKESSEIHSPYIEALLQHMSKVLKRDLDICPIT